MDMSRILALLLLVGLATPAAAQTSIRGIELSPEDVGRVQRQCNALAAQSMRSLGSSEPEAPEPGVIVSDPAGFWAENADAMDEALSRINLGSLTLRDCRAAGFF
jgi:hypothetical protein